MGCIHSEVYASGHCAACGALATEFPGLGTPHKMIPLPGTSFTLRPKATDQDIVLMAAREHAAGLMQICRGITKAEAIEAIVLVLNSGVEDGYLRARRLEDKHWTVDFQLAEYLHNLDINDSLREMIATWVEVESVRCPFAVGDVVSVPHFSKRVNGEIVTIDAQQAEVVVCVKSLGHAKEGIGTRGLIIKVEDLKKP